MGIPFRYRSNVFNRVSVAFNNTKFLIILLGKYPWCNELEYWLIHREPASIPIRSSWKRPSKPYIMDASYF